MKEIAAKNLLDQVVENRLKYTGLIEVNDEMLEALSGLENRLPALSKLKPLKFQRKFYTFTISSLLLMSTEELKSILEDKSTPALWKIFIKLIASAAKDGDVKKVQFLLDHASGIDVHSKDISGDDVKTAIVVLPNPNDYKEEEVMESQKNVKSLNLTDIDKELK